ncbi:MAG: AAA family ATPase [Candidatus Sericytochromatia bacterium]
MPKQANPPSDFVPPDALSVVHPKLQSLREALNRVILGKPLQVDQMLIALLAGGHVLLEDIPGIGKTTLAKAFALATGCQFRRIQFTPDLLPSDVIGASIYNPVDHAFHFKSGPVFTQILMADEINRASPRTQSSLLEVMAEQQITVDGQAYTLESPFMVIATQNPVEYQGTYPLPEAQLDRFMLCLRLGYPDLTQELAMLYDHEHGLPLQQLQPVLSPVEICAFQKTVQNVAVHRDIGTYIIKLVDATRKHSAIQLGASPRAGLALFQAVKAHALLAGRDYVLPEDVKSLAAAVLAHRLQLDAKARYQGMGKVDVVLECLEQIAVPR